MLANGDELKRKLGQKKKYMTWNISDLVVDWWWIGFGFGCVFHYWLPSLI
jgi:hypothetical protein